MLKQKPTDLTKFGPTEEENQKRTTKHLGATALLIDDVELLYAAITPLVTFPDGDLDSSDQLHLLVLVACRQLMITRLLFTKSIVAALRMYQGDSLSNLRRAIETCAFTVHMSKHRELCKVWCEAGLDALKYRAYRNAFRTEDVYRKEGHADFNPLLPVLKGNFDLASKLLHGSIFGSANHFEQVPKEGRTPNKQSVNFFDMPVDQFITTYFLILNTNLIILDLYGQVLRPHLTDFPAWKKEYDDIKARVDRHFVKWQPEMAEYRKARNVKKQEIQKRLSKRR